MLNTDRYSIDNRKLLGRLLPFFARGRKLALILLSSVFPLEAIHQKWREWALSKTMDTMATSQPVVISWYLKRKLAPYLLSDDVSFGVDIIEAEHEAAIFNNDSEQIEQVKRSDYWAFESDSDFALSGISIDKWVYSKDKSEFSTDTDSTMVLFAPAHNTSISDNDYIRLIKQYVDKYMVYDINYEIKIIG